MTAFVVIVYDANTAILNRSPYTRAVNQYTPTYVPDFNANKGQPWTEYRGWYMVDSQAQADLLAEALAKEFPGKCVKVSKVISEYQSETPKISKKTVSEKGTLPA
jgi:hypothetical protein